MRIRAALLATAVLAITAAPATAQPRDPVTGLFYNFFTLKPGSAQPPAPALYGGGHCGRTPVANVWWGRFAGTRDNFPGQDTHSAEGCFPSRAACLGWLYDLKTRYNDQPIHSQCRAGYQPGASIPPWWSNASD